MRGFIDSVAGVAAPTVVKSVVHEGATINALRFSKYRRTMRGKSHLVVVERLFRDPMECTEAHPEDRNDGSLDAGVKVERSSAQFVRLSTAAGFGLAGIRAYRFAFRQQRSRRSPAISRLTLVAAMIALLSGAAAPSRAYADKRYGPGVSDTEFKIGQTMPYSGAFSSVGAIGKSEAAYFRRINANGGVNGRHVSFISLDDGYSPSKTLEQTRRLVEQVQVLAIVGSYGTPTNIAIHKYLNAHGVPQLFIQAGASLWNDPGRFPWTIPLVGLLRSEAKVDATYILSTNPNARVAVLYQNDDFGRDYLAGLKEKFGVQATKLIVATASYEATDPSVAPQVIALQASGADTFFIAAGPKFTAQAIQKAVDLGWRPSRFIVAVSASSRMLMPAWLEKAVGVVVATSFKSIDDPQWEHDADYVAWRSFMHEAYAEGNIADAFNFIGYSNAVLFAEVLRRCGDDLTPRNVMNVATHLDHVRMPSLLAGHHAQHQHD